MNYRLLLGRFKEILSIRHYEYLNLLIYETQCLNWHPESDKCIFLISRLLSHNVPLFCCFFFLLYKICLQTCILCLLFVGICSCVTIWANPSFFSFLFERGAHISMRCNFVTRSTLEWRTDRSCQKDVEHNSGFVLSVYSRVFLFLDELSSRVDVFHLPEVMHT